MILRAMQLEMMTDEDLELRIRMETDPRMMVELGGPRPIDGIRRAHERALVLAAEGTCWPLKVIPDGSSTAAGWIALFPSTHEGDDIFEMGWMIVPEFQNRGLATEAVRMTLEKARTERRFGRIHAFPAVTNGSSNRICEKNGFTHLGECEIEFSGRQLHCNDWRIDLF
jgi:RimJ/RimL family protein N-acetyltransferase